MVSPQLPKDEPSGCARHSPPPSGRWRICRSGGFLLSSAVFFLLRDVAKAAEPAKLNLEARDRVMEMLSHFMSRSRDTNLFLSNYRNQAGLLPSDRDAYLNLVHLLPESLVGSNMYYGDENGTYLGLNHLGGFGQYREPANSGFDVLTAKDTDMEKHYKSCVNATDGTPVMCDMDMGNQYISCVDGCSLRPCPGNHNVEYGDNIFRDGSETGSVSSCASSKREKEKIYCIQYEIAEVEDDGIQRGFVPRTSFCLGISGKVTQEPGEVVKARSTSSSSVCNLGDCTGADGITLVNRSLINGTYAYCGDEEGAVCNNTFVGGYESHDYDPRYRPWYTKTRKSQRPTFTEPYVYFSSGKLGVTRTLPVYDDFADGKVFAGILAVDYLLEYITTFLVESYGVGSSQTYVAIFEEKEPNYIIALSTGTNASSLVLTSDPSQPCPVSSGEQSTRICSIVRKTMTDLGSGQSTPEEGLLMRAFLAHMNAGYPNELLPVNSSSESGWLNSNVDSTASGFYISRSALYEEIEGEEPRWRILVASPGEVSDTDTILPGMPTFAAVLGISAAGTVICSAFVAVIYSKRSERMIVFSDWRFTCAFIAGCALLNLSTMTLVGPNTDALCLVRMWSLHFFFVIALAPLLVKVYRMQRLVGKPMNRERITHFRAFLWCVPPVIVQVFFLAVVTGIDPPRQTEKLEGEVSSTITQHIVCDTETKLGYGLMFGYEACLLLAGCVLAFQTRNVDRRFRESKQLIASMYTISAISVGFVLTTTLGRFHSNEQKILVVVGTFWATIFSTTAFLLPRWLQVRDDSGRTVPVSGVHLQSSDV